ncbi:MAG: sulfurtransferase [Planctomycetes bacterium]|nr:sulfurtransferase [Planctomycetota bacterium]
MLHASALSIGMILGVAQPAQEYPRPELLVEPTDLAKQGVNTRILDARTKAKYDKGRVSGAVWVDHDAWNKAFASGQDADDWARRIGQLGIDNKTRVIVYDDAMAKDAARIWWILRYWGVQDARLVNGGFPACEAASVPLSKKQAEVTEARCAVNRETGRLASKDDMLGIVKDKKVQIVDARSEKEHCGEVKFAKKGGAMPGAVHLEWNEALDPKTQKFKNASELAKLLKDAGIDAARPIATHCQSGGRSSVMVFTLELMGAREVSNYYRGWSEWGNSDDTPIITPKSKR